MYKVTDTSKKKRLQKNRKHPHKKHNNYKNAKRSSSIRTKIKEYYICNVYVGNKNKMKKMEKERKKERKKEKHT